MRQSQLKEAVNAIRTRLAEREQAAENAERQMYLARQDQIRTASELEETRLEVHRLRQLNDNLNREMAMVTKPDAPIDEDDDESGDGTLKQKQYRGMIKKLRSKMKYCPTPKAFSVAELEQGRCYRREDFSKGWSHDAIWILGASVAALSSIMGFVTVESSDKMTDIDPVMEDENGELLRKHQTMQWFRKNISDKDRDPMNHSYVE